MNEQPKKIEQWAEEAYLSFEKALMLFKDEFPVPTDGQKMELVKFATPFAAMNRGIQDDGIVKESYNYVLKKLDEEFKVLGPDDKVQHSILFLLAYLNSHVSFSLVSEQKAEDVMAHLSNNYEICVDIG